LRESRIPTTFELLALMDVFHPAPHMSYLDIHSELYDHSIKDALDVEEYQVELLASFGGLGVEGATRLQQFTRQRVLDPLIQISRFRLGEEDIERWLAGVREGDWEEAGTLNFEENEVEGDESGGDECDECDRAASQEV
jgi:hypothetical protein